MYYQTKLSKHQDTINCNIIKNMWMENTDGSVWTKKISVSYINDDSNSTIYYKDATDAQQDFDRIISIMNNKKGRKFMQEIKSYFKKHQDTFITLAIIILVDQFVFSGKFTNRLKDMMESLITKTEKTLLSTNKVGDNDE